MQEPSQPPVVKMTPSPAVLILRALVRLVMVILIGVCAGVILYFGGAILYQTLVVQTSGAQNERIAELEVRLSLQQTEQALQVERYNQRLLSLEQSSAHMQESLSSLEGKVDSIETALDDVTANLERLDAMQTDLDALAQEQSQTSETLDTLQDTLAAGDTPLAELQREVMVLRTMELLNRSRLYLLQNNPGLAGEDMQNALATLQSLREAVPQSQKTTVSTWINRLELALGNLPYSPVLAAEDLEILWRMLVTGFNPQGQTQAAFPLMFTPTPTRTATPMPSFTSTPPVTPTP